MRRACFWASLAAASVSFFPVASLARVPTRLVYARAQSATDCPDEAAFDRAATRRDLGQVKADLHALVADETDFYWLELEAATMNGNLSLLDRQIRRAPRSPR